MVVPTKHTFKLLFGLPCRKQGSPLNLTAVMASSNGLAGGGGVCNERVTGPSSRVGLSFPGLLAWAQGILGRREVRPRDQGWNGTRREEREIEEEAVKHLMCDSGPKQEELQLQKHSLALWWGASIPAAHYVHTDTHIYTSCACLPICSKNISSPDSVVCFGKHGQPESTLST